MNKTLCFIALALALLMCAPIAFASDAAEWECIPEAGAVVYPGDQLIYRLTITEQGARDEWTVLTIRLGEGMRMQTDSFVFHGADTPQPVAEGEEPPPVSREIIPGNDGCVILASSLHAGDTAVFTAAAQTETALVSATAYTDDFSVEVAHSLAQRSTPTPAPTASAIIMLPVATPEPEGFMLSDAGRLAVGIAVFAGLLLFVSLMIGKHPIIKRFARKQSNADGTKPPGKVRINLIITPGLKGRRKRKI